MEDATPADKTEPFDLQLMPRDVVFKRGEVGGQAIIVLDMEVLEVFGERSGRVRLAFEPDGFVSVLLAALAGLGFGKNDLEYIAETYEKTFR